MKLVILLTVFLRGAIRLKVLLVNLHGDWGGAENVLLECAKTLMSERYEVTTLIPEEGYLLKRCRLVKDLKCLAFSGRHALNILSGVCRVIKNYKFDIIILNNQRAIALAPIFKILTNSKIIGYEHTPQPNKIRSFLLNLLIRASLDKYICVSKYMINQRSKSARSKCVQIYNGFEDQNMNLAKLNSEQPLTFGVLSIFRRWKGQHQAIEALSFLKDVGLSAKLIFIGGPDGYDSTYFDECKELVIAKGLQNDVEFLGFQTEPLKLMAKRFDILLQPSTSPDPLPTTVIEALLLGLPVIGYNAGGINEMVIDRVNGLLINSPSSQKLADAMKEMISNPKQINIYGVASRKLYEKNFTKSRYGSSLLNQLKSI